MFWTPSCSHLVVSGHRGLVQGVGDPLVGSGGRSVAGKSGRPEPVWEAARKPGTAWKADGKSSIDISALGRQHHSRRHCRRRQRHCFYHQCWCQQYQITRGKAQSFDFDLKFILSTFKLRKRRRRRRGRRGEMRRKTRLWITILTMSECFFFMFDKYTDESI